MVAIPEEDLPQYTFLTYNTWGLSITKPQDENSEVYTTLSTDADSPTIITDKDYEETGENDTTTVYYGFYITSDTPYGTYEGSEITYEVIAKRADLAKVVFDGNGKFYFGGDSSIGINTVSYIPGEQTAPQYSHTPNVNDEGVQTEGEMYPLDSNDTFVYEFDGMSNVYIEIVKTGNDNGCGPDANDYFSVWSGAHLDYTAKANWETAQSLAGSNGKNTFYNDGTYVGAGIYVEGNAVTISYTTSNYRANYCIESGYGYYAKIIGYNSNVPVIGEYERPETEGAYRFLGWSEDPDAIFPTYKSVAEIERALSLLQGNKITLYAISEPAVFISYDGNGADASTDMDNVEQYTTNVETTSQVDLLASNFTKEGYGFVGWSTDQNAWDHLTDNDDSNDPVIYGPNQTITIDPTTFIRLTLFAVWAPVETDNSGNLVSLQDWQGCSSLTATVYDSVTGTLNVGRNTITALADNRDGNIYTVARLTDGNCWMIENLRLDSEATISTTNTNNPLMVGGNVAMKNNNGSISNHLSSTNNSWCEDWNAECFNQSCLNTYNTASTTVSPIFSQDFTNNKHKDFKDRIYSYGNYYNWYSATAGNGTYEKTSGETIGDICPAGWILPIGDQTDANGSFSHLDVTMGGDGNYNSTQVWSSFPNNYVYAGFWQDISRYDLGSLGRYWSSTANHENTSFHHAVASWGTNTGTSPGYPKQLGFSVRCVIPVE